MMIQLEPMLPVYVPKFEMEGYAFLATRHSQEHYLLLTICMDNGEIWELPNVEVRFCKNITMQRTKLNKNLDTEFRDKI